MSRSVTGRERKAGGKNICARIRGERSAKGRERKKGERKKKNVNERMRE